MSFADADMMDPETHADDPYPLYKWLRENDPLYWDATNELWAVSRYDDVVHVSKNPDIFCSGYGVVPKLGLDIWPDEAMINLDGDAHTRQRGLVASVFVPRRIHQLEQTCHELIDQLISRVEPLGEADLMRDLARPLPFKLISSMLGYDEEKADRVLDWTDTFTHAGCGPAFVTEEVADAFANFCEFHEELLEQKKAQPGDDLLSAWLVAELDGHRLSEDKLLFEHSLLLVGGAETTRSVIGMGMHTLMRHPDQLAWLTENIDDDAILDTAVEELIRWTVPFVRMRRTATRDVEWYGKTIHEMDEIIMLYPAANRDPSVFENPDVFDIRRVQPRPALSFGIGKHFCLGASLARMEIRLMTRALLKRLPDMKPMPGVEPVFARSSFVRGMHRCPIVFTPRR